ncbi:MAG: thymidine kinase [Lachnospiraceae bacterium]|nr:thymidine kinase [Lachnospiraceae bacterium]
MAKLYFRYGAMGSSKTANALMVNYNYLERGCESLLLKPKLENRDGETIIRSRIGLEASCRFVEDFLEELEQDPEMIKEFDALIVDEAQFLSEDQVNKLADIVDDHDIPVICYGLRTDFQAKMFPGSRRLLEIADKIEEVKTVCWCGKKATHNARIFNGKIVRDGAQVMMGGNESYIALCRKHFNKGMLSAGDMSERS